MGVACRELTRSAGPADFVWRGERLQPLPVSGRNPIEAQPVDLARVLANDMSTACHARTVVQIHRERELLVDPKRASSRYPHPARTQVIRPALYVGARACSREHHAERYLRARGRPPA